MSCTARCYRRGSCRRRLSASVSSYTWSNRKAAHSDSGGGGGCSHQSGPPSMSGQPVTWWGTNVRSGPPCSSLPLGHAGALPCGDTDYGDAGWRARATPGISPQARPRLWVSAAMPPCHWQPGAAHPWSMCHTHLYASIKQPLPIGFGVLPAPPTTGQWVWCALLGGHGPEATWGPHISIGGCWGIRALWPGGDGDGCLPPLLGPAQFPAQEPLMSTFGMQPSPPLP